MSEKICRFCLKTISSHEIPESAESASLIVQKLFKIDVPYSKNVPQQICTNCSRWLEACNEFKVMVDESNKIIAQKYSVLPAVEKDLNQNVLDDEPVPELIEAGFFSIKTPEPKVLEAEIPLTKKCFVLISPLKESNFLISSPSKELLRNGARYQCKGCSSLFASFERFENHRSNCGSIEVPLKAAKRPKNRKKIAKTALNLNIEQFKCLECGKTFEKKYHCETHILRMHPGKVTRNSMAAIQA